MELNKDVIRGWVDDLRSGNHIQTTGVLCDGVGHCTLGVLCERAYQAGVVERWENKEGEICYGKRNGNPDDYDPYLLPSAVQVWAGLPISPIVRRGATTDSISGMNDTGTTFEQLADLIEATYLN